MAGDRAVVKKDRYRISIDKNTNEYNVITQNQSQSLCGYMFVGLKTFFATNSFWLIFFSGQLFIFFSGQLFLNLKFPIGLAKRCFNGT